MHGRPSPQAIWSVTCKGDIFVSEPGPDLEGPERRLPCDQMWVGCTRPAWGLGAGGWGLGAGLIPDLGSRQPGLCKDPKGASGTWWGWGVRQVWPPGGI